MVTSQTKERPIIFSGPMVNAILAGRKTVTRRVMKPQPPDGYVSMVRDCDCGGNWWFSNMPPQRGAFSVGEHAKWENVFPRCPYGPPGHHLWVRETWSPDHAAFYPNFPVIYRADFGPEPERNERGETYSPEQKAWYPFKWRSPIHMPRQCSRITLEVIDVRVERLQAITETDADAEGVAECEFFDAAKRGHPLTPHRTAFAWLWALIHGWGSWCTNPWVWVVSFKRVDETIGTV